MSRIASTPVIPDLIGNPVKNKVIINPSVRPSTAESGGKQ